MADPFAILQASQTSLPDIMNAASTAKQNRLREMMLNRQVEREDQLQQTRQKAAGLYRAGDRKGAKDEAIAGGDFDFADHMSKLDQADLDRLKQRSEVIGQVAQWADTPEKWDQGVDFLVAQGYNDLSAYKGKFSPAARMAALSGAGQVKDYFERTKPINMAPGNQLRDPITGTLIAAAPFAPHYGTVGEGQSAYVYQPKGDSGPISVETLRPHFVAQESGGNYGAVNRETGALGAYQVMPQTGQSLAQRLGLPWRPDLMTASTDEGKRYQDAIGGAAIQEAISGGGGDPEAIFSYYYGGSDKGKWGPRTKQYASEMMGRLNGGGAEIIAQGAPKNKNWHTLTPDETRQRGLPAGVYQEGPNGEIKTVAGTTGKNAPQQQEAYSQSAMDAFDRAIGSAGRLLKHPGFSAAVGSGFDPSSWGSFNPISGETLAGTDAADFRAELDALKAQVFLPMVQSMKGMGALSNAEGDKLTASIGALNPRMSEGAFRASLNRIITDLQGYKTRAARKPATPAPSGGSKPSVSNW